MVGGCRLHSHSRTTGQHESEIMSMSEVWKEAKLMQYNLEFCGMGLLPIVLHTDADVARAFATREVSEERNIWMSGIVGCRRNWRRETSK